MRNLTERFFRSLRLAPVDAGFFSGLECMFRSLFSCDFARLASLGIFLDPFVGQVGGAATGNRSPCEWHGARWEVLSHAKAPFTYVGIGVHDQKEATCMLARCAARVHLASTKQLLSQPNRGQRTNDHRFSMYISQEKSQENFIHNLATHCNPAMSKDLPQLFLPSTLKHLQTHFFEVHYAQEAPFKRYISQGR